VASSKLGDGARIAHVSAFEVREWIAGGETGLWEHDSQQRPELGGGASPEVVRRSGYEVAALLPEAATVTESVVTLGVAVAPAATEGGEERVELRSARRVDVGRALLARQERVTSS
jgi:hypothetical protein